MANPYFTCEPQLKTNFMNKRLSLIFILIFSCLNLYAQNEKYTAPVKWERYKVSSREVSVLLPKLPVAIKLSDNCDQVESLNHAVYAEESAFQFVIASKSKQKFSSFCREKKNFSRTTYENRIAQLKQNLENSDKISLIDETKATINGKEVTKLAGKFTTHWIFNDLKNNQWIELSITAREDISLKEKQFINSLEFGENSTGIEIGNGAARTLGDEAKADETKVEEKSQQIAGNEKTEAIIIVLKPRASYTDEARQAQTQGKVTLRVTFLANGGIGSITPIETLTHGLTEEAITAASQIVFLPQKAKGKTFNVSKLVQYGFTIY